MLKIQKRLKRLKKSELENICSKISCPTGTKKDMILYLLSPLKNTKYKMSYLRSALGKCVGNRCNSGKKESPTANEFVPPDDVARDTLPEYLELSELARVGSVSRYWKNIANKAQQKRQFHANAKGYDTIKQAVREYLFNKKNAINKYGPLSSWDVSNVTSMEYLFDRVSYIKGFDWEEIDLSKWDVSNVTNMQGMFFEADAFNGDISGWDVSNVTDMRSMFKHAISFNGDISGWDVSNVTNMRNMFYDARSFNRDINTTIVTQKDGTIYYITWDVSNVTSMEGMFEGAISFNRDISEWDVSNVTNMEKMFYFAKSFNRDLSRWDVSNVTNMEKMFWHTKSFKRIYAPWYNFNI